MKDNKDEEKTLFQAIGNVKRHNSTNVLHLPLPFQPLSKR